VITREEVLFAPGLSAQFLLNDGSEGLIPVDLQGVPCPAGRCWDFSAAQAGDVGAPVAMLPVAGAWYAEDFPDASYATVLDREQGWLGLFQLTDAGLFLLGSASERADVMQTAYSPPVELYRFPLQPGSTWVSTSSGSGYWGWSPVLTTDTYTVRVAAAGEVTTPAGRFRALQVITHVEQEIPFTWFGSSQIVHTFFSECNGIVARVVSEDGEEDELFGRAAALERLAGQD